MDWTLAIEKNRAALRHVLSMLVGMIEVAGNRPAALPRNLHRFVLRLLRPAESAARRLIIVAARGLVVELASPRTPRPKPQSIFVRDGVGTGIVRIGSRRTLERSVPKTLSLPLFDPFKRFGVRRRYVKPSEMPRIRSFDDTRIPLFHQPREPDPPPHTPDDPLDAGRLSRRLDALASALDDLPRQAKRFARWRARLAQGRGATPAGAGSAEGGQSKDKAQARPRSQRLWPMRPGRPPGWQRRSTHAIDSILNELHGLAFWALERPDTS